MLYAARKEKESPCFLLAVQESKGESECRRKGQLLRKSPGFGVMGSCEFLGKIQEIRKDEDISSLQGWSKVLKSLRFWFW